MFSVVLVLSDFKEKKNKAQMSKRSENVGKTKRKKKTKKAKNGLIWNYGEQNGSAFQQLNEEDRARSFIIFKKSKHPKNLSTICK